MTSQSTNMSASLMFTSISMKETRRWTLKFLKLMNCLNLMKGSEMRVVIGEVEMTLEVAPAMEVGTGTRGI